MSKKENLAVVENQEERITPRISRVIEVVELTEDDRFILRAWNEQRIIQHKESKIGLHNAISFALSIFSEYEIVEAIRHYSYMYHDEDYIYCKYKWDLPSFLTQPNALPEFLNDGKKWNNYYKFWEQRDRERQKQKESPQIEKQPEPEQQAPVFSLPETTAIEELYTACITALKTMPYKEYIQTEHWQHFRREALKHFNRTCQLCGANDEVLHVHHKTYINRGRETFNDVILLCCHCHDLYHHNKDQCTCPRCLGNDGEHEL